MGCDQTEKISLLIDGELAAENARALELHLSACSECDQVRADFLGLRSQISTYSPLREPIPLRPALAAILSKSRPKPTQARWWSRFFGMGEALAFNPRFAALAALVLITLAIGAIALLRQNPQPDVITRNPQAISPEITRITDPAEAPADANDNSGPKRPRVRQRETGPGERKPRSKPAREPSAPKPLPQPRNAAPPNYAFVNEPDDGIEPALRRAGDTEAVTASHFEQSVLLLRAFRNLRASPAGRTAEIAYERRRARQLLYRNIRLQREAENEGDVQVATLLGSLQPILLDIANLRDQPRNSEVQTIKERVERTSMVPLLQINSMVVARAN